MIDRVAADSEHEDGEPETDDAFDRRVGAVLESEAELLRERSEQLIATGWISIDRPRGVVTARLRPPRWWRRGQLAVSAETEGSADVALIPVNRAAYRDRDGLRAEITLQLAVQLAGLDEPPDEGTPA